MKLNFLYFRSTLTCFCLFSLLFNIAVFLTCFFPVKRGAKGFASLDNVSPEPHTGQTSLPEARFRRLVLLVVDGLRTDFLLGQLPYMPFTQNLLQHRHGRAFSARTHLPTVTLPRIKVNCKSNIFIYCYLLLFYILFYDIRCFWLIWLTFRM